MANKINSLLSKKGWSGEEVGRAAIKHLIEEYVALTNPGQKPSLSIEDIERLRDSIKNEYDGRMFNRYMGILRLISDVVQLNQSYEQQFYNGFYRLVAEVNRSTLAATTYNKIFSAPMIMTQAQYDNYYELAKKHKTEIMETPAGLFFQVINYYSGVYSDIEDKPTMPKDLEPIAEAMKSKPFKNKEVFAEIAKANGDGYYLFEDGTRSDELTDEEYQAKLKETQKDMSILYMDKDSEEFIDEYIRLREKQLKKRKKGMTAEDIANETEEHPTMEWIWETDLTDDITEWDIVWGDYSNATSEVFYFNCGDELVEGYELFKETFPELSAAIIKHLSGKDKKIKSLFTGKHSPDDELISWGELAELNILNYVSLTTPDEGDIRDEYNEGRPEHECTRSFSIAILKNVKYIDKVCDDLGGYVNPLFAAQHNLIEQLNAPISDIYRTALIEPALKQLFANHFIISTIGNVYDFPEMSALLPAIEVYKARINAVNGLISMWYDSVKDNEKMANAVIEGAQLIELKDLQPTEEAKEKAVNYLRESTKMGGGKITNQSYNDLLNILLSDETGGEGAADDE